VSDAHEDRDAWFLARIGRGGHRSRARLQEGSRARLQEGRSGAGQPEAADRRSPQRAAIRIIFRHRLRRNGLKREQLVAMSSMILHDVFFDGLGEESEPGSVLAPRQKLMDESVYTSVTEIAGADRIGNSMRAAAHGAPPAADSPSPAADLKPGASVP
jgi:hypothetical protein